MRTAQGTGAWAALGGGRGHKLPGVNNPAEPLVIRGAETEITICTRGGHLMTWLAAGQQRLWMSPLSKCGDTQALRGGVPILFPQFSTFGPLTKHGFARVANWVTQSVGDDPAGAAKATLLLRDSAATRAAWPSRFELKLEIEATSRVLHMALSVLNEDDYPASFTAGLHNYFALRDPQANITGLAGLPAWDQLAFPNDPTHREPLGPDPLVPRETRDLIVDDAADAVVLHDAVLGPLRLEATGFPQRVVWNPGPGHNLPDVRPGDEADFVCIEPAVLSPVEVAPGATWVGTQTLTVL